MTDTEDTLLDEGDGPDEEDEAEAVQSSDASTSVKREPAVKSPSSSTSSIPVDLDEKRLIEAALFISARPLGLDELRHLTGVGALGYLKGLVQQLQQEYIDRGSALEILELDGTYSIRVRNQYLGPVKQFAQETEISKTALRTLAYIAKHDGVLKSHMAKHIGPQIYQDVQELAENGFVKLQKAGRSSKLILTEKFKKYFAQG